MMKQKLSSLFQRKFARYLIVFLVVAGGSLFYINMKALMFPGPLSSVKHMEEDVGGYSTHASFEQECGHCHAPVHCIADTHCQDCHLEIAEQRISGMGLHSMLPGTQRCQTCHPEHRGRDSSVTEIAYTNVDHDLLSGFSLVKHQLDYEDQPMNCESCHMQGRFAGETLDCATCHAEQDHDAMADHIEEYGKECVPCHNGNDRMMDFDHNLVYVLDGVHVDTACVECHDDGEYEESPRDCITCHEDPEIHAGVFGTDCVRCHTTDAWSPAYLTGHTFFLNHGAEENNECETCHVENYESVSCYDGCHDHKRNEMARVHEAEGYSEKEYADCKSCHPTGIVGEADKLRNGYSIMDYIEKALGGAYVTQPGVEENSNGIKAAVGENDSHWSEPVSQDQSVKSNPEVGQAQENKPEGSNPYRWQPGSGGGR